MKLVSRKYQWHRAVALLAIGAVSILVVRAHNTIEQNPSPTLKQAPELVGQTWLNTDRPLTLSSRRGKVTLVEFWTFGCSNCAANLPTYERWQKAYGGPNFAIISVHTPELKDEYRVDLLKRFVKDHDITYPILVDNDYKNWARWKQEYWPAIYLVDKNGRVRDQWLGELGSEGTAHVEAAFQRLIRE